ncbi:MAG: ArsR/SmtB family transcription factor [Thermoanaerobaculaceae bacterium]
MTKKRLKWSEPLAKRLAQVFMEGYITDRREPVDQQVELVFQRIAERLKSLADPTRLAILHLVQRGEKRVTDILAEIGGSQANISKHLGVLRQAGFVTCRREGVSVYYSVTDPSVFPICRAICDGIEKLAAEERQAITKVRGMFEEER